MGMSKTINLRKEKLSSDIESISLYSTLLGRKGRFHFCQPFMPFSYRECYLNPIIITFKIFDRFSVYSWKFLVLPRTKLCAKLFFFKEKLTRLKNKISMQ